MSYDVYAEKLLEGLSELFDAAIHGERVNDDYKRLEELDEELKKSLDSLRLLQSTIEGAVEDYVDASGDPEAKGFAENVKRFFYAAQKQEEARLQKKFTEEKKAVEASANSEAQVARVNVEGFLSRGLLKTGEAHFSLKLVEDSYVLTAKYMCPGEIEYAFTLDTKANPTLKGPLTPSALGFKPKIPVAIGKSWIKQSSPQMVKLDKYVLTDADATDKSLIYVLRDPDGAEEVRIVYTKNDRSSNVSITYKDQSGEAEVTDNPALAKYLDLEDIKLLSDTILESIIQLEYNRLRLTELSVGGEDTLAKNAYFDFMLAALDQLPVKPGSIYAIAVKAGLEDQAKEVLEKIQGFGDKARAVYAKFTTQNQRQDGAT